jgi:serine/threonine protein phosphatase PrpC
MVLDIGFRMERNLIKAIDEHHKTSDGIMTYDEYQRSLLCGSIVQGLISSSEARGKRPRMEDAHFISCVGENTLVGLFDGNNGARAARFSNLLFAEQFPQSLSNADQSVHAAFMQLFPEVHRGFLKASNDQSGTTALVAYIDYEQQKVCTATLGDSEAFLYRKINGVYKALPLSCVRNWGSKKDARRAALAYDAPAIASNWPEAPQPKALRVHVKGRFEEASLNVSRAIGDRPFLCVNDQPLVIQKPKITEAVFQPGDVLITACDGVWDYLKHADIIQQIEEQRPDESLAKKITLRALDTSTDNITVVAVRFSTV